jgi:hypothetical protein
MMNEIPTTTRTGERTGPFLMVGQKKSRVDSRFGQLAKFEAAREDESATRTGKPRWKVFGHLQDAWPCIIPGLDLVYSVWLP